jgi:hypothetical protein
MQWIIILDLNTMLRGKKAERETCVAFFLSIEANRWEDPSLTGESL